MFWRTSILAMAILFLGCSASDKESVLIEIDEYLESPTKFILIDLGPEEEYSEGHIKGAINIHRSEFANPDSETRGMAMSKEDMEELMRAKGIESNSDLILYDRKGGVEASRLWWILKMYGFENAKILNGGLQVWSGDLSQENVELMNSDFQFTGTVKSDMKINYDQLERWRKSGNIVLLDNRSQDEFDGKILKSGAAYAGHIPGAINICYTHTFSSYGENSLKIKNPDDLSRMYAQYAAPNDTVVLYCHSGVRSAHTYMVMTEILDYKYVYNYDGSWIEWSHKNNLSTAAN